MTEVSTGSASSQLRNAGAAVTMDAAETSPPLPNSKAERVCIGSALAVKLLLPKPANSLSELYTVGKKLDSGTYGEVKLLHCRATGEKLVLKTLKEKGLREGLLEILKLGQVGHHPHVCRLVDVFQEVDQTNLVFEFAGQSLRRFLTGLEDGEPGCEQLSPTQVRHLASHISSGLQRVHGRGVAHGDLSSNNVLIDTAPDGSLKAVICDFGTAVLTCCREEPEELEYILKNGLAQTTRQYRAPEVLWGDVNWGLPADIWAWGCLFAELLTHQVLFGAAKNQVDLMFRILSWCGSESAVALQELPLFPKHLPKLLPTDWPKSVLRRGGQQGTVLLSRTLQLVPSSRMTATDICNFLQMQSACELKLLRNSDGESLFTGNWAKWSLVDGYLQPEVLQWILDDPFFTDPAGSIADLELSWDAASQRTQKNAKRQKLEKSKKLQVAGWTCEDCNSSWLNAMNVEAALPCPRVLAVVKAWKKTNEAALCQLQVKIAEAIQALPPDMLAQNKNAQDMLQRPSQWVASCGAIQLHRTEEGSDASNAGNLWREDPHNDGGASLIHIGLTLAGVRKLTLFSGSNDLDIESELECKPGHFYMGGLSSVRHMVTHSHPQPAEALLLPFDSLGNVECSVMFRTSLFRHYRQRLKSRSPKPTVLYNAATTAIAQWLGEACLKLPTLRDCELSFLEDSIIS